MSPAGSPTCSVSLMSSLSVMSARSMVLALAGCPRPAVTPAAIPRRRAASLHRRRCGDWPGLRELHHRPCRSGAPRPAYGTRRGALLQESGERRTAVPAGGRDLEVGVDGLAGLLGDGPVVARVAVGDEELRVVEGRGGRADALVGQ